MNIFDLECSAPIYIWSKVVVTTLKEVRTIKQLNYKGSVSKHYISVGYAAVRNKIGFVMKISSITGF
jgi:hypothetical protein